MKVSHKNGDVRRRMLGTAAATAIALFAFGAPAAFAQAPAMRKSPVRLNRVDVAGDLALTQDAIENYQKENPHMGSKMNFTSAQAPEVSGKLTAMHGAGGSDLD